MSVDNLVGQTLGAYELHSLLGSGGMGAVYRAVQTTLRREVALKVLPSELARQPGYIDRFTREAKVAAALEHPHIVPIYDYGTQRDISYVVMRLLTGGSLSDRIQQAQENSRLPSLGEISDLLRQLVSALEYAHSRGVIHRDIKPSNVMFDAHGNAYLVDFGIAKLLGATNALTGTGQALGTPSYMPPEQWRDDPITPAADQYALAVLVYSLLTGRLPFEATTLYALMHKHLTEAPPAPQTYRADVPPALTDVLDRALAKTPEERFSTVTEFSRAFDAAAETNRGSQTGFFYVQPQTPIVEGQTPPPLPPTPPAPSAAVAPQPPGNTASTLLPPVEPRRGRSPLVWIVALVALAVVAVGVYLALPRPPEADSGETRTAVALAALNAGPTDTPTDLSGQAGATQTAVAAANDATGMPAPADTGEPTAAETEPPTPVSSATSEATAQVVVLAATNTDVPPTETITPTPTDTEPPSATPTLTHTPTATPSHTPAATPTATPTPTDMPTDEPTATATPTPTDTPTDEPTLTATPTNTPTDLPTATATLPPTDLPTATEPPAPLAAISLQFDTPSSGNGWGSPVLSEDTGQTITWMVSPLATLPLWLEQGADYNLKFRLTGVTAPEVLDSLTLAVNGVAVPLTYRDDREGARVYDATIPADAIGAGPSVLAFKAREAGAAQAGDDSGPRIAAFDWLRVEARALPDVAVTPTAVPTANAAVAQIEIGQRVEGNVSPGADERWAFAGHTDEHILVTLTSPGMEMALELLDPSGATIAADQTSTDATNVFVQALLPVDGTYTLVVRAADGAQAGAYRLRLLEAPPRSSLYVEPATLVGQLAERGVIAAVRGELAEEPGAYIIDLTSQDDTLSRVHLNGQYTDFVMGGTLTFGPGAPDDACGFVFYEINDQNYYLVEIDQQGLLSFVEQQRGEWQPAQQVELTDVKLGAGASNQVVLVAVDNRFQVSVNDAPFTQFEDNSLAGGLVSIEATTFADSDETYCVFTDVWLWNLGG